MAGLKFLTERRIVFNDIGYFYSGAGSTINWCCAKYHLTSTIRTAIGAFHCFDVRDIRSGCMQTNRLRKQSCRTDLKCAHQTHRSVPLGLAWLTADRLKAGLDAAAEELNCGLHHHGVLGEMGSLHIGIDRVAI